jgi:hypothetical protein
VNFRGRGRGEWSLLCQTHSWELGMSLSFDHHPRLGDFARFQPGRAMDRIHACSIRLPVYLPVCLSPVESLSPPPPPPSYRRVGEKITVLVCVCVWMYAQGKNKKKKKNEKST